MDFFFDFSPLRPCVPAACNLSPKGGAPFVPSRRFDAGIVICGFWLVLSNLWCCLSLLMSSNCLVPPSPFLSVLPAGMFRYFMNPSIVLRTPFTLISLFPPPLCFSSFKFRRGAQILSPAFLSPQSDTPIFPLVTLVCFSPPFRASRRLHKPQTTFPRIPCFFSPPFRNIFRRCSLAKPFFSSPFRALGTPTCHTVIPL